MSQLHQNFNDIQIPYRSGSLWGYSDLAGNITIPPQYEETSLFDLQEFLGEDSFYAAIVKKNNSQFIIDPDNLVLSKPYKEIDRQCILLHQVMFYIITDHKTNKKGVFFMGIERIAPQYEDIELELDVYFKVTNKNKVGLVDIGNNIVIPVKYDHIYEDGDDNMTIEWVALRNGKEDRYTTIKKISDGIDTDEVVDNYIDDFSVDVKPEKDFFIITRNNDQYGVELTGKNKSLPAIYNSIETVGRLAYRPDQFYLPVSDKQLQFIVSTADGYGIIDEDGIVLVPLNMDTIQRRPVYYEVRKNGKTGIYRDDLRFLLPPVYDMIESHDSVFLNDSDLFHIYKIRVNNKSGWVGENGIEYFED